MKIITLVTILSVIVFPFALLGDFKADKDVSYGPHERNVLDVYWNTKFKNAPIVFTIHGGGFKNGSKACLLYTSPSPRDRQKSRMPSSA